MKQQMAAKDFAALYFDWMRASLRVISGEPPDPPYPPDRIVSRAAQSLERRKKQSSPSVVLTQLAMRAIKDPDLIATLHRMFFQLLLDEKVLKPKNPFVRGKRGRPRSHWPSDEISEPGKRGARQNGLQRNG